jgi:murein DD-endopeptidase MepM/ murein hydrolase activator NlpD
MRRLVLSMLPAVTLLIADEAWARTAATMTLLPPVSPACISSPFGPRILPNRPLAGTFHYGIDLPAPEGAPVHAIAPGEVIRVQRHGPGGLEMLVQHPGFVAVYSHLGHVAPVIADGRRALFGGEIIGVVGHTGVTYGMHLYFGMFVNGHPVDPAPYLAVTPCGGPSNHHPPLLAHDDRRPPSRLYEETARVATK